MYVEHRHRKVLNIGRGWGARFRILGGGGVLVGSRGGGANFSLAEQ